MVEVGRQMGGIFGVGFQGSFGELAYYAVGLVFDAPGVDGGGCACYDESDS
jgi:hypothetical protein